MKDSTAEKTKVLFSEVSCLILETDDYVTVKLTQHIYCVSHSQGPLVTPHLREFSPLPMADAAAAVIKYISLRQYSGQASGLLSSI